MEDVTIPGWFVWILCLGFSLFVAWMVWITVRTMENHKDIVINTINDNVVGKELIKIHASIAGMQIDFKTALKELNTKIDNFLDKENDILRDFAKRNRS